MVAALLLAVLDAKGANPRRTVVIADLHFGVGMAGSQWHPYEDFRWLEDLSTFLTHIAGDGIPTDVVLNGDTFELWQSSEDDCVYENANLGCTEAEAFQRLRHILRGHARELEILRDFTSQGDHCIYIVPGNHDAALMYPTVANAVIDAFDSPENRILVMASGHWLASDGLVIAAHGHQMDDVNRYDRWPDVFISRERRIHLQKPWGEQFVQKFYSELEQKYPIIDNIEGEVNGVRYGLAAEGLRQSVRDSARLVKFFLTEVSRQQFGTVLGPSEPDGNSSPGEVGQHAPPGWNVALVRQEERTRFFAESLPRNSLERPAIEAAVEAGLFDEAMRTISDREILEICATRAALHDAGTEIALCPPNFLRAGLHALFSNGHQRIFEELRAVHTKVSTGRPPFAIAVFSHTHKAEEATRLNAGDGKWKTEILNTGAWQRITKPEWIEKLRTARRLSVSQVLRRIQLEDLPACYPFIVIDPYPDDAPKASLRHWLANEIRAGDGPCGESSAF